MVQLNVLNSPRLKVQRAYRHIDDLRVRSAPLDRELYTLGVEPCSQIHFLPPDNRAARVEGSRLMYRPSQPIGEIFALIIGDALHNLRGALDHLATGIARTASPQVQVHFPMAKVRNDLVSPRDARGGAEKSFTAIEKALPGSERLILNEIRPDHGRNEKFWAFHVLNNDDKHNLLVPTISVTNIEGINLRSKGMLTMKNCAAGGDATKPFSVFYTNQPLTIEQNFQTSVDVRLSHVDVLENEPAIPALTQIAEVVTETINAFERLIGAQIVS